MIGSSPMQALLGLCAACLVAWPQDPKPAKKAKGDDGYALVFADEFDGDGPVRDADWVYEEGFVRNEELQYYKRDNVRRDKGVLILEARREECANEAYAPTAKDWRKSRKAAAYTSGSIKTKGKHEWLYGRLTMRARIDVRAGLWPAFWTVGSARPWPGCGEIDIMEYFQGVMHANAAWASAKPGKAEWNASKHSLKDLAGDAGVEAWARKFHEWRMDWDPKSIRIYCDGTLLNTIALDATINQTADKANPLQEPHHIILNLAIGGTSGGDPAKTAFPARFEVDWVRVYQAKTASSK